MGFWLSGVSARWWLGEGSSAPSLEGRGGLGMGNRACIPMVGQAKRGVLGGLLGSLHPAQQQVSK